MNTPAIRWTLQRGMHCPHSGLGPCCNSTLRPNPVPFLPACLSPGAPGLLGPGGARAPGGTGAKGDAGPAVTLSLTHPAHHLHTNSHTPAHALAVALAGGASDVVLRACGVLGKGGLCL